MFTYGFWLGVWGNILAALLCWAIVKAWNRYRIIPFLKRTIQEKSSVLTTVGLNLFQDAFTAWAIVYNARIIHNLLVTGISPSSFGVILPWFSIPWLAACRIFSFKLLPKGQVISEPELKQGETINHWAWRKLIHDHRSNWLRRYGLVSTGFWLWLGLYIVLIWK